MSAGSPPPRLYPCLKQFLEGSSGFFSGQPDVPWQYPYVEQVRLPEHSSSELHRLGPYLFFDSSSEQSSFGYGFFSGQPDVP